MRDTDKSEAIVSRTLRVAGIYTSGTFTFGCLLGTARQLAVAPALGTTTALVVELPIMIAASVGMGRWCLQRERHDLRQPSGWRWVRFRCPSSF